MCRQDQGPLFSASVWLLLLLLLLLFLFERSHGRRQGWTVVLLLRQLVRLRRRVAVQMCGRLRSLRRHITWPTKRQGCNIAATSWGWRMRLVRRHIGAHRHRCRV
jgi:hypothetical protein